MNVDQLIAYWSGRIPRIERLAVRAEAKGNTALALAQRSTARRYSETLAVLMEFKSQPQSVNAS